MRFIGYLKEDIRYKTQQTQKGFEWFQDNYRVADSAAYKSVIFLKPFLYSVFHSENFHSIKKRYLNNGKTFSLHYKDGGGQQGCDNGENVSFYLPNALPERDIIQYYILRTGHFFEEKYLDFVKSKYLYPGMTVIDCGANIGNHTVYFAKICKASKVISFEAVPSTYNILKRNIELNELSDTVEIHNNALGDTERMVSMKVETTENIGGAHVVEGSDGSVKMIPLDSIGIDNKVDFIKIDVEGYEYNVLMGARGLISKYKPIIMIEIWDQNFIKVNKLLMKMGYTGIKQGVADYIYLSQ